MKDDYAGYLIKKGAYYYRPECAGYTGSRLDAGRYTHAQATRECSLEPDHFTMELAPECQPDGVANEILRMIRRSCS